MRIQEDLLEDNPAYTPDLRNHVSQVLEQARLLNEMKALIKSIRQEAFGLHAVILNDEEQKEIEKAAGSFDTRMQAMALATFDNLEQYRFKDWKEFIGGGDEDDG